MRYCICGCGYGKEVRISSKWQCFPGHNRKGIKLTEEQIKKLRKPHCPSCKKLPRVEKICKMGRCNNVFLDIITGNQKFCSIRCAARYQHQNESTNNFNLNGNPLKCKTYIEKYGIEKSAKIIENKRVSCRIGALKSLEKRRDHISSLDRFFYDAISSDDILKDKFIPQQNILNFCMSDMYDANKKIVIFLDGCFWHGCKIHNHNEIGKKIRRRDHYINSVLRENGYIVVRFWEHTIYKKIDSCLHFLRSFYAEEKNKKDNKEM
jgi:very-short-patch-repair endonuclease